MATKFTSSLRLDLQPTPDTRQALEDTLTAYQQAMAILDLTQGANVVALHQAAYEAVSYTHLTLPTNSRV